jgi:hypothetical protein
MAQIRAEYEIKDKLAELRKRLANAVKETQKSPASAIVVFAITREMVALEWVLGRSTWEGNVTF